MLVHRVKKKKEAKSPQYRTCFGHLSPAVAARRILAQVKLLEGADVPSLLICGRKTSRLIIPRGRGIIAPYQNTVAKVLIKHSSYCLLCAQTPCTPRRGDERQRRLSQLIVSKHGPLGNNRIQTQPVSNRAATARLSIVYWCQCTINIVVADGALAAVIDEYAFCKQSQQQQ